MKPVSKTVGIDDMNDACKRSLRRTIANIKPFDMCQSSRRKSNTFDLIIRSPVSGGRWRGERGTDKSTDVVMERPKDVVECSIGMQMASRMKGLGIGGKPREWL